MKRERLRQGAVWAVLGVSGALLTVLLVPLCLLGAAAGGVWWAADRLLLLLAGPQQKDGKT